VKYRPPREIAGKVRVDTGVQEGAEISMFYDPMIAKLVTGGETREEAIDRMRDALDDYYIRGLGNNLGFLAHLVAHPRFRAGDMTTNFIAEEYPDGLTDDLLYPKDTNLLAAVSAIVDYRTELRERGLSGQVEGGKAGQPAPSALTVFLGEENPEEVDLTITPNTGGIDLVTLPDQSTLEISSGWRPGDPLFEAVINDETFIVQVDPVPAGYVVSHAGTRASVKVIETRLADLQRLMPYKAPPDMSKFLLSPMPGLLVRLSVEVGDTVKPGQELAVVEAMKMENVLRAEQESVVQEIHAAAGDSLAVDQKILAFE